MNVTKLEVCIHQPRFSSLLEKKFSASSSAIKLMVYVLYFSACSLVAKNISAGDSYYQSQGWKLILCNLILITSGLVTC